MRAPALGLLLFASACTYTAVTPDEGAGCSFDVIELCSHEVQMMGCTFSYDDACPACIGSVPCTAPDAGTD